MKVRTGYNLPVSRFYIVVLLRLLGEGDQTAWVGYISSVSGSKSHYLISVDNVPCSYKNSLPNVERRADLFVAFRCFHHDVCHRGCIECVQLARCYSQTRDPFVP